MSSALMSLLLYACRTSVPTHSWPITLTWCWSTKKREVNTHLQTVTVIYYGLVRHHAPTAQNYSQPKYTNTFITQPWTSCTTSCFVNNLTKPQKTSTRSYMTSLRHAKFAENIARSHFASKSPCHPTRSCSITSSQWNSSDWMLIPCCASLIRTQTTMMPRKSQVNQLPAYGNCSSTTGPRCFPDSPTSSASTGNQQSHRRNSETSRNRKAKTSNFPESRVKIPSEKGSDTTPQSAAFSSAHVEPARRWTKRNLSILLKRRSMMQQDLAVWLIRI